MLLASLALAGAQLVAAPALEVPQLEVPELLQRRADDWVPARLRGNPAVLVIEFPSLAEQGAAMNRAAALIEKSGAPRDRVLGDTELQELIARQGDSAETFYQGHGYVASQLARFFTLASRQGQALKPHEERLRRLLIQARAIAVEGDVHKAQGLQAVISFSATQSDDPKTPLDETVDARRRESVLRHELSHGLFFTSRTYRDHCWRFWRERLSEGERKLFRRMLTRLNYDPLNEELMVNEAQAFLMHTPDQRAFNAASLGISIGMLADLRRRFLIDAPSRSVGVSGAPSRPAR